MDFNSDYKEISASDWSEAQSAQSREIAFRGILIRDVCVLSLGNFDLGTFRLLIKGHYQTISSIVAEYSGLILMSTFSSTV